MSPQRITGDLADFMGKAHPHATWEEFNFILMQGSDDNGYLRADRQFAQDGLPSGHEHTEYKLGLCLELAKLIPKFKGWGEVVATYYGSRRKMRLTFYEMKVDAPTSFDRDLLTRTMDECLDKNKVEYAISQNKICPNVTSSVAANKST